MRSDWVSIENMDHVLAALMPANRLAIQLSMATGLRIGDVLSITREQMAKGRFTVTEQKTGKKRRVRVPVKLQRQCLTQAGKYLVFPGRLDETRPRSRQAVYKDVIRASVAFRLEAHVSPHTARKIYAVNQFDKKGLDAVQRDLGHSSREITMIYAMAREITMRKLSGKK
uniref:Tyr recombinase domain-containing protein n=1 Tax=uncultured prokaryote TaxID=198431 RepID=A0A0H5Q386_9ZZZZ|nr:hypothetical protein [uncultured prokaryote]